MLNINRIKRGFGRVKTLSFSRLLNRYYLQGDKKNSNPLPKSYPVNMVLALSNICDRDCPMCSIETMRSSDLKRVKNDISMDNIKAFSSVFKRVESIGFFGFYGESILNPRFGEIVKYLKENFKNRLFVSTNGLSVNEKMQNVLVDNGFDSMNFSIHAMKEETYRILQGEHHSVVLNNLVSLQNKKRQKKVSKPFVTVVFAINKANIEEAEAMVDFVAQNDVEQLEFYHYHDYGKGELAFAKESDFEYANKKLDQIYLYAKKRGVLNRLPLNPPYFNGLTDGDAIEAEKPCYLPWEGLQIRSSYSYKDCFYMGCCNTFNIFLLNIKEHVDSCGKFDFDAIWSHEVFQYLRMTVNTNDSFKRNPICAYCKSSKRKYLKNTNNKENHIEKLKALKAFFDDFYIAFPVNKKINGLTVLEQETHELLVMSGE